MAAFGVGTLPLTDTAQATPGDLQWEFETGGSVFSSPTVVDETVFVGSYDGNVYALDVETGEKVWDFETGDWVKSSPMVVDGSVFIGSYDGHMYSLNAADGTEQWRFETGNQIVSGVQVESSPMVVDGTVFFGCIDDNLYALDATDGTEQWRFETDLSIRSSPIVVDETVFFGSDDGNVYALDVETGKEDWIFETGDPVMSSPTIADGTVFVGSGRASRDNSTVYAIDTETGEQQWTFETAHSLRSSPTELDGTVFIGGSNLYALNAETGGKNWTFETEDPVMSSPAIADDTVYVGSGGSNNPNNVYAVDVETGERRWSFDDGDPVRSSPTVVDGVVFIGSDDGYVYALHTENESSSEGTRTRLGALGHHRDWRYAEDNTIDSGGGEDFQPGENGFGFENWSGTQSWSVDGEDIQYEPDDVSEEEIQELVEDVWPSDHGEALIEPVIKYVYTRFNGGGLTNGHCYGMVHAAMEYFEDPSALPDDVDTASDIPYPVGEYESVGHDIRFYRQAQFFDSESRSSVFSVLWPGYAEVDLRSETKELREALTQHGYAPISLADPANDEYHQVLGYDIEADGTQTIVYAYDPNAQAAVHELEREQFRLEVDDGPNPDMRYFDRGEKTNYEQFVSMTNSQREADLQEVAAGAVITALIGAAESTKSYLQASANIEQSLGQTYVRLLFAGLQSPAHLEVDGPDDTSVLHPDIDESEHPAGKYSDAAFIFGAPAGEYSYTVVGDGEGEYTLELRGASEDTEVISKDVTGEITSGEQHTVSVTIPEEGEADVAVQTETGSNGSTMLDVGTVAGGGAVTAGLLYLAYRMRQDETAPK